MGRRSEQSSIGLTTTAVVVPHQTRCTTLHLASARAAGEILVQKRRAEHRNASAGTGDLIEILNLSASDIGLVDAFAAAGWVVYPLLIRRTGTSTSTLARASWEIIVSTISAFEASCAVALLDQVNQRQRTISVICAPVYHLHCNVVDPALRVEGYTWRARPVIGWPYRYSVDPNHCYRVGCCIWKVCVAACWAVRKKWLLKCGVIAVRPYLCGVIDENPLSTVSK